MSRALNVDAPQEQVLATCARHKVPFTQIETLVSGGTRVVTQNAGDAALLASFYKGRIIGGLVVRTPVRNMHV